jgi:micrococcal nuclease
MVTKVVDGDTIWVDHDGRRMKIRMIGLDTPESVDPRKPVQCFALEASAQAKTILGGQSVYLETDPSQIRRRAGIVARPRAHGA